VRQVGYLPELYKDAWSELKVLNRKFYSYLQTLEVNTSTISKCSARWVSKVALFERGTFPRFLRSADRTLTGDQNNFPAGNYACVRTHTDTYSMINSTKSPASGAGMVR